MIESLWTEVITNGAFYRHLLVEHIEITMIAVVFSVIVGMGIGIAIADRPKIARVVISIVNALCTIPAIALLGVLISITGIGNTTAIIALILYALLPIVRGTTVGIMSIDPKVIEAAVAMGSRPCQTLLKIKLPLAMPILFASLRNMVTMTIALAGIASFVGAGGLGVAIYRGITTNNDVLIIIGSVLIAALALFVDAILGWLEHLTLAHKFKERRFRSIFWVLLALFIVMGGVISMKDRNPGEIKIASKPTSEGYILAEIVGQLIENTTPLKVTITHGIGGGTSNIQPALLKGEFDLYPEYTGTAWQIVLKNKAPYRETEFLQLQAQYKAKYHLDWKGMFGFDNTYSLGVRKDLAEKYHLKTFSDLAKIAPQLTFGAEYDFFEREDGFKSLSKAYHFTFKKTVDMDNGLKYQSLFDKKIDVMTVFTTDGQLSDPRIQVLKDDLGFYPNYMAGMVVREDTLKKYPALGVALSRLNGLIDEKTMAQLNKDVEIDKLNPREVAIDFLKAKHLWVKHHD